MFIASRCEAARTPSGVQCAGLATKHISLLVSKGVSIYAGPDGYKHATTKWLFVNFVDKRGCGSLLSLAH
jgi:hypothetical protein